MGRLLRGEALLFDSSVLRKATLVDVFGDGGGILADDIATMICALLVVSYYILIIYFYNSTLYADSPWGF